MRIRATKDEKLKAAIRKALEENDGYCPCRTERTPETKCMCKEFLEQESGACYCGLYIKEKD